MGWFWVFCATFRVLVGVQVWGYVGGVQGLGLRELG